MQNCELLAKRQVFSDETCTRFHGREQRPEQRLQEREHDRQFGTVLEEGQPRFGCRFRVGCRRRFAPKPPDDLLATTGTGGGLLALPG